MHENKARIIIKIMKLAMALTVLVLGIVVNFDIYIMQLPMMICACYLLVRPLLMLDDESLDDESKSNAEKVITAITNAFFFIIGLAVLYRNYHQIILGMYRLFL